MTDFIIAVLDMILGGSFTGGIQSLGKDISIYNTAAYNFALEINNVAVKPVAAVILSIILVLEFARISSKVDGDQKLGAQLVGAAIFKACLIVVAIQNVGLILKAINSVGTTIIQSMAKVETTGVSKGVPDDMRSTIENLGTVDLIGLFALLLVPLFVTWLASIIVQIVIFLRFAEIYILSSAATLPLVFMGHPETKPIALGYLRKYGAAVLHGGMIIVAIKIYETFQKTSLSMDGILGNGDLSFKTLGDFVTNTGQLLIAPLFFIFLILATGRFAKALVGE
ncbi:hypothetical protein EBF03_07560 [Arcanobacterium haemolyticum]|uniref:TrbL/VirB6 plasmid conjugal transfer protein n=1 Tax=Arcanobacterium haemolyticum (strain ATCC 9345 / DSM 20595 / CCM 5947 / CCUG 17215 / LMG 16163 / NBRC 15585 / NCTC 8452 / 11018) TaxID=644284 RepID=D7BKQ0_ARCHD|nr:hypothetical protein [Arcanobacterium haemolyticum]ADH93230.1 conserved hypothetical protein [Arcanobacterium haemolyticum DSM 20595]QCX47276.1 hypothetical protein EBF03_07560 [Arcanobacterium haemolyticum]SQH28000.1 Uncharacterised protein [Arcanobacterium haemolyticum]